MISQILVYLWSQKNDLPSRILVLILLAFFFLMGGRDGTFF